VTSDVPRVRIRRGAAPRGECMPNDDGIGLRPRQGDQDGRPAAKGEKRQELEPTKRTLYETLYGRLPFGDATTPGPAPV